MKIEIKVKGPAKSGKTRALALVKHLLRKHGAEVRFTDDELRVLASACAEPNVLKGVVVFARECTK